MALLYYYRLTSNQKMIKILISDLVHKKLSVSEALTRAKLIGLEINNGAFKNWLEKELEGYEYDDVDLPSYRKISSPIYLVVILITGEEITFTITAPNEILKEEQNFLEFHQAIEPITAIEKYIEELEDSIAKINLPANFYQHLFQFLTAEEKTQVKLYQARLHKAYREIGKVHLNHIIEMTKQKLIDILVDLHKEFPNLMDNFQPNKENNEKLQNIVTTNIYGGTNPMNIAVGEHIRQQDITFNITVQEKNLLKSYGLEDTQISELELIDKEVPKGSSKRKDMMMSWLGKVTASLAAKGLHENLPNLTEFIGQLL